MLLTITSTSPPATDLGFLLHKNPAAVRSVDVGFGVAHAFYPAAEPERCTIALWLRSTRSRWCGAAVAGLSRSPLT